MLLCTCCVPHEDHCKDCLVLKVSGVNSRFSFFQSTLLVRVDLQPNPTTCLLLFNSPQKYFHSSAPSKRCRYLLLCGILRSQGLPVVTKWKTIQQVWDAFPPGGQWHDGKRPNCCVHRLSLCSLHAWVQKQFINAFLESLWSEKHVLKHTKYSM